MVELIKMLAERRGWAALVAAAAAAFGLKVELGEGTPLGEAVAIVTPAFIGTALFVWSRLVKLEGRELYRRILAPLAPMLAALIASLVPELGVNERTSLAQGLAGLVGLALGGWSFRQENTIRPARNP